MNVIHQEPAKLDHRAGPQGPAASSSELTAALRPRRRLLPWLGLVLVLGGGAYYYLNHVERPAPAAASTQAALSEGEFRLSEKEMRALRIEPVASRDFRPERMADGRIAYNDDRSTPMLSPYTGRVMRAFARVGDRVEAGAPLYEIETPDVTGAANDLLGALDNVQKATVALAQARREDARQASLFSARAASQRDVEQARAASAAAESDLRSAHAQAEANRDRLRVLGRTPDQIAEIERTRQVSGLITVTAPMAGTITQRRAGPGQWLTAGQGEPVFTLADLSTMWLIANVREMDVPMIRVGQPVDVRVNALPDRHFDARIVRTAAGLDPATRRLMVMAEIQDPGGELRPEMFATFRIEVGETSRAPAVPASAVIFRGDEANVWVSLPEGRFAMRRITPGLRSESMIEARAGLADGDRVVTGGALFIDRASRID
ncbi:efflux RND transporter periplasmic adaptor subunit [Roseococcus sp. SYP-B2431]|uniref:efflux RND transporter periplasmic adaptor subunit n=1 Tax=Roseococcus sp. SYP-B2431 TaxID=2496640 RepID=UPI00103D7CF4|nr:efflux RND transporter periplasmic adaptor subunit [Roseococcus sp. SYP-B2431]TCH98052.1 efflux RND transporter periplasmic adaptor subunit [Roseococcus sp. SYP-B2431]